MVKNITIKDEAYEYLRKKKGDRSFSDVILSEAESSYNQKNIQLSREAYDALCSLAGTRDFSGVLIELAKTKATKQHLQRFHGVISDKSAKRLRTNIKQGRSEMEKEIYDRNRHLFSH